MMVSITTNKSVCRTENEVFIKRANTIVDYYAEKFILSLTADCPGVVKPVKYVDTLFEIHMPNYPRPFSVPISSNKILAGFISQCMIPH